VDSAVLASRHHIELDSALALLGRGYASALALRIPA
jgi:hypothetical protein